MKFVLFLLAGMSICAHVYAQRNDPVDEALRIMVGQDDYLVTYQNQTVVYRSMPSLDSCIKAIVPGLGHQTLDIVSSSEIDTARVNAVQKLLAPYHCPIRSTCYLVHPDTTSPAHGPTRRKLN